MDHKTIQNAKILAKDEHGIVIRITTPNGVVKDFRGNDELSLADQVYDCLEIRDELGFSNERRERAWTVIMSNIGIAISRAMY